MTMYTETLASRYQQRMAECEVPMHLREGLLRYLLHHIQPGHFLVAVLENDLLEAVNRADVESMRGLVPLVRFLYMHAPRNVWGSAERVTMWLGRESGA